MTILPQPASEMTIKNSNNLLEKSAVDFCHKLWQNFPGAMKSGFAPYWWVCGD
jgi:hypothetical protein